MMNGNLQRLPGRPITGRQACHLTVPGTDSAAGLSVERFRVREAIGEPYFIPITVSHQDELDRADYLGKEASFTIDYGDGRAPRVYSGYVQHFSKLKTSKDFSSYKITLVPHIRRLDDGPSTRIYQRKSAPEIIEAIMRARGLRGHQFDFRLRRQYPQHDFRFQYGQSDWQYIRMLMEKEGIYCYITAGEFGDVVVFGDDIDHYVYQPELKVLYREMSGMTSDELAVSELQTHTSVVPKSFLVAEYNPQLAWERLKAEVSIREADSTTSGQPYVYGTHHLDMDGARWEARLRHEAAIAWQVVYEGKSNILELSPGRILRMDEALPDAPNGQLIVEVTHTGGRQQSYYNRYKSIPCDRRFRLPMREHLWPRIGGTITARITSPGKYKYAYLTPDGRYVVRFDCDFAPWNRGGESVPLRLAKPFAGALQTGFHFPLIDGTEVGIAFIDGNPDKPYIAHAHHHSQATDLITNQDRWLSRNVIRTQSNNKIRMEDWEREEHIKISTEHSGKSQLSLGHLVDNNRQKRGEGFELRTSGYGAIRAGKGLLVSANDQPATSKQIEMAAAKALLHEALQMMQGLAQAAQAAQTYANDVEKQRQLLAQRLDKLQEAVILLTAPKGIALVSGDQLQASAKNNVTVTAGEDVDVGAGKNITLSAANAASIYAQNLGIKIVAAKEDVETVAHTGQVILTSQKDMKLTSVNGELHASATKSLILSSGGAYIKISGGNVEIGCPGTLTFKRAGMNLEGPASLHESYPPLSNAGPNNRKFGLHYKGRPDYVLPNERYRLHKENGSVVEGFTDANGDTSLAQSEIAELVRIELLGRAKT